jgi:hypothetical protein
VGAVPPDGADFPVIADQAAVDHPPAGRGPLGPHRWPGVGDAPPVGSISPHDADHAATCEGDPAPVRGPGRSRVAAFVVREPLLAPAARPDGEDLIQAVRRKGGVGEPAVARPVSTVAGCRAHLSRRCRHRHHGPVRDVGSECVAGRCRGQTPDDRRGRPRHDDRCPGAWMVLGRCSCCGELLHLRPPGSAGG